MGPSCFLLIDMSKMSSQKTFRLAHIHRKINKTFQSPALKAALLAELEERGEDTALVVDMVEKVRATTVKSIQAVAPQPNPNPSPTNPAPAPQPGPAPRVAPIPGGDGSSQEEALEVLDSEDELVSDMTLSPRREQRLRRLLQIWRERMSSGSD